MNGTLEITLNGHAIRCPSNTPIAQMLVSHPHPGPLPALGAVVDHRMGGLNRPIRHHATITTIDASTREGMEIYRRTAGLIFYAAMAQMNPQYKVQIGQSFDEGYYFDAFGFTATPALVAEIEQCMRRLVTERIPLDTAWTPIEEAMQIFERVGRTERVRLLRQMQRSDVPLITIRNYTGFAHGPVAPNTGLVADFKLHAHAGGIVLEFPDATGRLVGTIQPRPKLLACYQEHKRWNEIMQVENVAQLNELTTRGTLAEMIKVAEALHEKKIAAIADTIAARSQLRCVLIAGPSSSGKTTFTKRLAIQLRVNGIHPIEINLDNYFVNREQTPLDPEGAYDFESLHALDLKLLNQHLGQLLAGETVATPIYSFPRGRRIAKTRPVQLQPGQVLLIEGIHGLNDQLTATIPAAVKFKVFVSALTQLCIDDHNRIFTSDSRLIRRIVRDRFFRGRNAAETIAVWPSVRRGERENILPFTEQADVMYDSALCYEQAVLKTYAVRALMEVPSEDPAYVEALRLFRYLDLFVPALVEDVPQNSILREFLGGSWFRY